MKPTHLRRTLRWVTPALVLIALCVCLCVAMSEQGHEVRVAELAGEKKATFSKNGTTIDYGNSDCGYIMIKQKPVKSRLKVKVTKGDESYNYDLNSDGEYEVLPLQFGNGKYKVQVFKQIKGTSYSAVSSTTISVKYKEDDISFLYPNQYVWYKEDYETVAQSFKICEGLTSDKEKVTAVYKWVSENITYDYILAMQVKSGYLPDVEQVIKDHKAICFGYSAVMGCMLRVQGIPTQLVIGYADKTYHAWNKILVDGEWVRYDSTFASTKGKAKTYTPERFY